MKYDFDTPVDRSHTNSVKWDAFPGSIPMWVADMDYRCAPEIIEALRKRVDNQVFGYTYPDDSWKDAYICFWHDEFGLTMERDWIMFALGVVPILSSSVRAFSEVGDEVIVTSPVYNIFFNSIRNNNRVIVDVPLKKEGDDYSFDFEGLEKAFSSKKAKLMILCNPANPVGKPWEEDSLRRIGELSNKYGVIVLSDEIHSPILREGKKFTPYLSIEENRKHGFAAISPTKAFNLAGIQTSAAVVPDLQLREKLASQLNIDEVGEPNAFSCLVSKTALNEGREWLKQANRHIFDNWDHAVSYINKNMPLWHAYKGDSTYLMWIEAPKAKEYSEFLLNEYKVKVSPGEVYGGDGISHIRLNLACPRCQLDEALNRMSKAYSEFYR